jgi:hypothetical protein
VQETTRKQILSILDTASQAIWNSLRSSIPSVQVQCERYRFPDSELCAWGTFSTDREAVSLCLTVQSDGDSYHVIGDIYHEDGRHVGISSTAGSNSDEMIVQLVREFVAECS